MRRLSTSHSRARSTARRLSQNARHALVVCVPLVLLLAGGLLGSNWSSPTTPPIASNRSPRDRAQELSTGSLLFVPLFGDRCRQMIIDNATWSLIDNGTVDCTEALNLSGAKQHEIPAALAEGMRDGFQRKP